MEKSFGTIYVISIHALRVEGDRQANTCSAQTPRISIHALRVEGDNPPLPEGLTYIISIHALRVEGDYTGLLLLAILTLFLSTPSGWRAT